MSDIFELSFRWQDGAVQVIIYALVIYLGLVIISKITDKRERGQEMKHYHYIVKWSEGEGWRIDPDTESANFPNGTIYDEQEGWQFGYLGEGEFNGKEEELSQALTNLLDTANTKESK